MIRKLICLIKAIPFFIKTGVFVPHIYVCSYEKAIIIADEKSFRVSTNYRHKPGERVYKDACLITYTCKHCGHKTYAWYPNWNERWKLESGDKFTMLQM